MSAVPPTPAEDQCPECFRFGSGHKMTCSLDESPGRIAVPVGFDAGGILTSGVVIRNTTMRPVVTWDADQIATFERLADLLERWDAE